MAKESDLERLKKEYLKIQKKYGLPEFKELNQEFSIEKVAEVETEILVREVRKLMAEKLAGYMRFAETLLNPVNAPMFVFSIIKTLGNEEKKTLAEIYKKLAENEINLIELDTMFSEKGEADFIKHSYKLWKGISKEVMNILDSVKKNWGNKFEVNNKGYFG